jgi:hypothetical protein
MVKLKIGAMGVQRDGKEVGPFEPSGNRVFPFAWGGQIWREDGTWSTIEAETSDYDIVRVFGAPAAELSRVDLTNITTPLKYLPPETVAALEAHKGPIEFLNRDGAWFTCKPTWMPGFTYRAKPAPAPEPAKPREWWLVLSNGDIVCKAATRKKAAEWLLQWNPGSRDGIEIIRVVESTPSC